jgi:hypothetical protein
VYEHQWEQAVEHYLTVDRGIFVSPKYLVGERGGWERWPDFLAVDFRNRCVWTVEVTVGNGDNAVERAVTYDADYVPRIKAQLVANSVVTLPAENDWREWSFGFWLFAPTHSCDRIRRRVAHLPLKSQITALEEVAFEWQWWDERFR